MAVDPKKLTDIVQFIAKHGVKYVRGELEKDAANRYSLKEDWYLPLVRSDELPAGEYRGEVCNVESDGSHVLFWFNKYDSTKDNPICDGPSCVPDVLFGIDLRQAAVGHDPLYREMEKIAKAFGVPVSTVRRLVDQVFTSIVLAENRGKPGAKTVATMAHWAIRLFGGAYHKAKAGVVVVLASLLLAGCGGCVGTFFEDPDDYESPTIEKVE